MLEPLRPSSFARVIACPGSRRMTSALPKRDDSSIYSVTGTAAHDLAARCLTTGAYPFEFTNTVVHDGASFGKIIADSKMVVAVSHYVGLARRLMSSAAHHGVEQRVSIPGLDMDKGGTVDFWAYEPKLQRLTILDYKNGEGVEVPLVGPEIRMGLRELNAQAASYAWGKLVDIEQSGLGEVRHIDVGIVQPNARSWKGEPKAATIPRDELFAWLERVAYPAVLASRAPDAPLQAGPHCRKTFCPARGGCPAAMAYAAQELIASAADAPPPPAVPAGGVFQPYED